MSAAVGVAPVFLCHGAGGDAGSMAALARELEDVHGVPARPLSYPGRADMAGPPRESVAALAEFVRERVEAELGDLAQPHVVLGHSMGGAVAIEYGLGAPTGLRALVLVSTGARLRVHPSILAALASPPEAQAPTGTPAASFARSLELASRAPRDTALSDWRAADAFDRMARAHEISTPTLVVVGDADVLTPLKYARFLHERIVGSQLAVLPGAGHTLPTDHAPQVAALAAAFLSKVPAV